LFKLLLFLIAAGRVLENLQAQHGAKKE